jgi:hypothetical protein
LFFLDRRWLLISIGPWYLIVYSEIPAGAMDREKELDFGDGSVRDTAGLPNVGCSQLRLLCP